MVNDFAARPEGAIYGKGKASPGYINLGAKRSGERSAGNPHATFDEAGAGDDLTVVVSSSRVR